MGDRRKADRTAGSVTHPDEMIHLVLDDRGAIVDAGIDEFVELERVSPKYLKLTLTGRDATKPVVLMIVSETEITVREWGKPLEPE